MSRQKVEGLKPKVYGTFQRPILFLFAFYINVIDFESCFCNLYSKLLKREVVIQATYFLNYWVRWYLVPSRQSHKEQLRFQTDRGVYIAIFLVYCLSVYMNHLRQIFSWFFFWWYIIDLNRYLCNINIYWFFNWGDHSSIYVVPKNNEVSN